MRVTVLDYGAGNLHSLAKALQAGAANVVIERDPLRALETDVLVLPGVGAFGAAASRISPARSAMREAILGGLPVIGVCLGMQLLFEESEEGEGAGLGIFAGRVERLRSIRIPQMGWNSVEAEGMAVHGSMPSMAYYANSFVCRPMDDGVVTAWTTHEGDRFPAAVRSGSAVGVQFHPEKSSNAGVRFLQKLVADSVPNRTER